ncbi:MAG: phage tail protein [bacterium]
MGLAKLQITPVDGKKQNQAIEALFNPKEYTISKSVPWNPQSASGLDAPELQFTTGQGETLQLELFFDTYEAATNVKTHTDKLHELALIDTSLHRPPMVLVTWGTLSFKGVVESLNHRFTMFMEDGTPVRATCSITLRRAENARSRPPTTAATRARTTRSCTPSGGARRCRASRARSTTIRTSGGASPTPTASTTPSGSIRAFA